MIRILLFLMILAVSPLAPGAEPDTQVPVSLRPWIPWVLDGDDRRGCPWNAGGGEQMCAWPGELDLDLDRTGGLFTQQWRVYAETWVPLPGGDGHWPQDVRLGTELAAVVQRDGAPVVKLTSGKHALSGRFQWRTRPEGLSVPAATGLIALRLDGEEVAFPRLELDGRLWLGETAATDIAAGQDTLSMQVHRRIDDDIPLRVVTRLQLDVAGRARELVLGPVLLEDGIPLGLESPLPARLEPDGGLRLQVRPGHWVVEVTEHHPGPVNELGLLAKDSPWPTQEVWVFAARADLRQVEVGEAESVDPRQTRLPQEWTRLPAYLMHPDAVLRLTEVQRGDANPVPDRLSLSRDLWLDFGGGGYTVRDRLSGELTRSWRLEIGPRIKLGQVLVDGEPRFITRIDGSDGEGVEVRQGQLQLAADGRIESGAREIPASGWALDLESVEARLNLPPGWDLLAAVGVDNLPDTWVNRWTLLDLFLVLIIALAVARLWGPAWGGVTLVTMVLIWQEAEAPRMIWLSVLAAYALLRLLPTEPSRAAMVRLRALLGLCYRASLVALLVIALPFLVGQVRNGIYPQLEQPWHQLSQGAAPLMHRPTAPSFEFSNLMDMSDAIVAESVPGKRAKTPLAGAPPPAPRPVQVVDPDARIQTGPGIPTWHWRSVSLGWNGPVPGDYNLTLWLLSPTWGLVIAILQLILILLLGLKLAGILDAALRRTSAAAVVLLAAGLSGTSPPSVAADFPSPELLEALKTRLLEPPDCLPACVDIPRMLLVTKGSHLELELRVDAQEAVALPVPGNAGGWVPTHLTLDGAPLDGLRRDAAGGFLAPVPAGRHVVTVAGPLPPHSEVGIVLPLRPRFVETRGDRWRVEGLDSRGMPAAQLRLVDKQRDAGDRLAPADVPPLLHVRRTLHLGVDWRLETEVSRLSPPRSAVALEVPLIQGEDVLSEGRQVTNGRVLVNLPPGQMKMEWTSRLEPVDSIVLRGLEDERLSEEWRVELSPLWHLETEGIAPVHHRGPLERWLPTWRPWPGEEVRLMLSRPVGVPGPTLTLDRSLYRLVPGRRLTEATLELTLRSSQGGRHSILLPEGVEITGLSLDGGERPPLLEGRSLPLALAPGTQHWTIRWRQSVPVDAYYSPAVPDVGLAGVNASVQVAVPDDRWILFAGGPGVGPAVLFWGLVVVLVPVAFGLGRSPITPLKGRDWLLLGLGLSQAGIWVALLVAGCLFALGLRARLDRDLVPWHFNLMQTGLAFLGLAALFALIVAVHQGLLGSPQMQIAGNGSTAAHLQWYQDRSLPELPRIWVISVPVLVYRGLMLAWALWFAIQLLAWLRWGWQSLSEPVLWRETGLKLPGRRREAGKGGSG